VPPPLKLPPRASRSPRAPHPWPPASWRSPQPPTASRLPTCSWGERGVEVGMGQFQWVAGPYMALVWSGHVHRNQPSRTGALDQNWVLLWQSDWDHTTVFAGFAVLEGSGSSLFSLFSDCFV